MTIDIDTVAARAQWSNPQVPDHIKALVKAVIAKYCGWLNHYGKKEWDGHNEQLKAEYPYKPYKPGTFLEQEVNEYADTSVEFWRKVDERILLELTPYDGDDGGPATLWVIAERDWHFEDRGEKQLLPGGVEPRPVKSVVEDDTYTLHVILQEFDANYSVVYNKTEEEFGKRKEAAYR
jgi:hypothetical protein